MLIKNIKYEIITDLPRIGYVFKMIQNLEKYYPNFNQWYWNKLVPDILLRNDMIIGMFKRNEFVGVSILKNQDEKKIRAIRILPRFQKKGYGLFLIDKCLEVMKCDKPHATVAEELLHQYARIFINRYDFNISKVEKGIYRKGKLEYIFN